MKNIFYILLQNVYYGLEVIFLLQKSVQLTPVECHRREEKAFSGEISQKYGVMVKWLLRKMLQQNVIQ